MSEKLAFYHTLMIISGMEPRNIIRYAVLGSGSNGNSYAFYDGNATLLVDQGYSLVELKRRMEAVSIPFSSVRGLCVTHLHPDHVRGVGTFARKTGLPVFFFEDVPRKEPVVFSRLNLPPSVARFVPLGTRFPVGSFVLHCFPTSHDSGGSVGWSIADGDERFMVLSDTGVCTDTQREEARESDILFLEANYDADMLGKGPYPPALKRRIAGKWGHLSNDQAISFLKESGFHGSHVYFVHLSAVNNDPVLLEGQVERACRGSFTVCEKGKTYQGSV